MKFKKEDMKMLAFEDIYDDGEWIIHVHEQIDSSRWSIHYYMVFEYDGKCYESTFSRGATESQDERPYDDEGDLIECQEVEAYEVIVTKYRKVTTG